MKIGLLTYYGDLNPGTVLQAYSIYSLLEELYGHEYKIEIINIYTFRRWNLPLFSSLTLKSLWRELIKIFKYRTLLTKLFRYSGERIVTDRYDIGLEYIKKRNYSAIYVGSDTLLELFRLKRDDITIYYLPQAIKAKKYFVAASCRETSVESLTYNQRIKITSSLSSFNAWGVRDESTKRLMENLIPNNPIELTPDPTFSYKIDYSYAEEYIKNKKIDIEKEKLICVHFIRDFKWRWKLIDKLKKDGYKIVSIRPFREADYEFNDMSPLEYAGIFKYFTLTITHRFHDSVFSLKNLTPILIVPPNPAYSNKYGESKYTSLCKDFEIINSSYINNPLEISADEIYKIIPNAINSFDKVKINAILAIKRNEFIRYLNKTKEDFYSGKN